MALIFTGDVAFLSPMGVLQAYETDTSLPGKSVCPSPPPLEPPESVPPESVPPADVPPDVVPPAVVPPAVVPPAVVPPAVVPPAVVPPVVVPPPSVTLMVAPGWTASFGAHLVSVEIGLDTLMLYASGVSVISPALSSFSVPFMSGSTMGLFLGIGGFCRGPSSFSSPLAAPPTLMVPVGFTVSLSRSRMSGFLEAAATVFQTTSISSPTFASAGAVSCTLVVPCTAGSPEMGGGMHSVLYETSAAWAGLAASTMPAPPSISATPAALILRCVLTNVPSSWVGSLTVRNPG